MCLSVCVHIAQNYHLYSLQAKVPGFPISIVGTFTDKLRMVYVNSLEQCDMLRSHIIEHFASPSSSLQVEIEDIVLWSVAVEETFFY